MSSLGTCSSLFAFSKAVGRSFIHFQLLFLNTPLWLNLMLFFLLKGFTVSNKILYERDKTRVNLSACNRKGPMCWPAIVLTLINNLSTIGTWCSSPSHIIHPIRSIAVLSPLSFGALRSLRSSLTNRSLLSFRTWGSLEWLVFARLACFSWKEKDFLEKPCYYCLSRTTAKSRVFKILVMITKNCHC